VKKLLSFLLKIGVSLGLLALLFRSVDLGRLRDDLARLDLGRVLLLASACWLGQFICAQRWRLFAAGLGMRASYRSFAEMYFLGMLFNIGLPSLVGGDVIKAYMLRRRTAAPLNRAVACVLQDRAAGLISLLIYGSAAALVSPLAWRGIPLWVLYAGAWTGIAALGVLLWKGDRLYSGRLRAAEPGPDQDAAPPQSRARRLLALLAEFHGALATMRLPRPAAGQVLAASLVNSAIIIWAFQQVSVAAGHPVPLGPFTALFPLITLVTMAPVTLGGVGIREWSYVEAFRLVGITPEISLAIALTTSAVMIAINLPGAILLPSVPAELRKTKP
jgi:uncharacterized protein (TIRG00374 family)